ncbi:helix-turn-helix domain-containing protein [uncultured Rikenella sp.]|uniref:helix-turn-helix domain-containing protein n=1 Tax=uncultured Rikenella sp. TaxID=368003 RepID=UPI00351D02EE
MKWPNSEMLLVQNTFFAGSSPLKPTASRLRKLEGGLFLIGLSGRATIRIDLKSYEIRPDTYLVLLPGSIVRLEEASSDCTVSLFSFTREMFGQASMRLELGFFTFLKEHPCYTDPTIYTSTIRSLMQSASSVYADSENRFQTAIAQQLLRCLLLEIYDKSYRVFGGREIVGGNRQEELFKKFIAQVHEYADVEREVSFYSDKLCISAKYLTGICRQVVGTTAKTIIDEFAILEIKALLQSTELTIQEISDRLRFTDQSYLGRYFKRHEGISPKEYRNNHL